MTNIMGAIMDTIPITMFDQGCDETIFEEIRSYASEKVIIKNDLPECVIMSPKRYEELMEKIEQIYPPATEEEISNSISSKLISLEEMDKILGITQEELDAIGEVEFE